MRRPRALAIIPARGGSQRIPRKNLWPLAGAPLVVHSIRHALAARAVAEVVVSTDDDEIAEISRAAGATVPPMTKRRTNRPSLMERVFDYGGSVK